MLPALAPGQKMVRLSSLPVECYPKQNQNYFTNNLIPGCVCGPQDVGRGVKLESEI